MNYYYLLKVPNGMNLISNSLLLLCLLLVHFVFCSRLLSKKPAADIHASSVELEDTLRLHRKLLHKISKYISEEEEDDEISIKIMKKILQHPSSELVQDNDVTVLIGHPVNLFLLYSQWHETVPLWGDLQSRFEPILTARLIASLPQENDVSDSALTLLRLQSVYGLNVSTLILSGDVKGVTAVRGLEKEECFEVAEVASTNGLRGQYEEWFEACLERVGFKAEVNARKEQFKIRLAAIDDFLLNQDSDSTKAEDDRTFAESADLKHLREKDSDEESDYSNPKNFKAAFYDAFKELCQMQNETSTIPSVEKCVLYGGDDDFSKLLPLKLEFHSYDPLVVTFHQIVGEGLMADIREGAGKVLEIPRSFQGNTGEIKISNGRTGKVAFYKDARVGDLDTLSARLTGLDMKFSEALQVVSYGIGGHYEPHVDYFNVNPELELENSPLKRDDGDRIATLLYYLNDVQFGGATVFPKLGLSVKPNKGSALFWYNLHKNGTGDPFTMHAGCPVLLGEKWIANHWFHTFGQEATRRCDTDREI